MISIRFRMQAHFWISCMTLKINIIGGGIVGKTIAKFATSHQAGKIQCILNSRLENAQQAAKFVGAGLPIAHPGDLLPADIHIISTPDEKIEDICAAIAELNLFNPNSIVMHCSGTVSVDALKSAKSKGCYIARVHPIRHMHSAEHGVSVFPDTYCVIEGDDAAYKNLYPFFTAIQAIVIRMGTQHDNKYHTAGVFAAAYHQMIIAASARLYEDCGIEKKLAVKLACDLAKTAINNIDIESDYKSFVEGPIKRADVDTIAKNRKSLTTKEMKGLYDALGKYSLSLTEHSTAEKQKISAALETD